MKAETTAIKTVCDKCGKKFLIGVDDIKENDIIIEGKLLKLVFFVCPECDTLYKIALEDEQTIELKQDVDRTKKRIKKAFGNKNVSQHESLIKLSNRKQAKLKQQYETLNKKYNGSFSLVATENNQKAIFYKNTTTV